MKVVTITEEMSNSKTEAGYEPDKPGTSAQAENQKLLKEE